MTNLLRYVILFYLFSFTFINVNAQCEVDTTFSNSNSIQSLSIDTLEDGVLNELYNQNLTFFGI